MFEKNQKRKRREPAFPASFHKGEHKMNPGVKITPGPSYPSHTITLELFFDKSYQ